MFLLAGLVMIVGNVVDLLFVNYSVQPWDTYWVQKDGKKAENKAAGKKTTENKPKEDEKNVK